jgi:hypothetical protein
MWVRLKPVMVESRDEYPPPDVRWGAVSGLHWIIPKGRSAPGKVSMLPTLFPPMPVPTNVSTRALGEKEPAGELVDGVGGAIVVLGAVTVRGGGAPHPLRTATGTTTSNA